MVGENKTELTREFAAISSQNLACEKPVFHASLSLSPGEKFTDEQWNEAAKNYLNQMGFTDDNQYIFVRHTDKEHDHVHIIANRVNARDLNVVKDGNDFRKSQTACKDLERQYGLSAAPRRKNEQGISENGKAGEMRKRIDEAIKNSKGDNAKFLAELKQQGVTVKLNQQSTGRVAGATFATDSVKYKGSELGRGYSWQGIQQRLGGQENKASRSQATGGRLAGKVAGKLPGMRVAKTVQKAVVVAKKIAKKIENEM